MRLLFVGRCSYEKGIDIVIELAATAPQHHVVVAGAGPYADSSPDVEWLGWCTHEQLVEQYRSADFLLMPSRFLETFGMSALEAVYYAVPVIAPDRGALVQFVHPDLVMSDVTLSGLRDVLDRAATTNKYDQYTTFCTELQQHYTPAQRRDNVLLLHEKTTDADV